MIYIGALVFVTGLVLRHVQSFEGVMIVEQGRTEQWVTRPAGEGRAFATAHRNMPAEVIGFDNPRVAVRVLGTRDQFDATPLPWRLKLAEVEVLGQPPDTETLEVIHSGSTTSVPVTAGETVSLPEGAVVMKAVEPWHGLIRDGRGSPMAALSLKFSDEPWTPVIIVDTTAIVRPRALFALAFRWFPNEGAAREPVAENERTSATSRWGVSDVGRIHWFDSLLPGTGVTTTDGTTYTLLTVTRGADDSEPPINAITVERERNSETTHLTVGANQSEADPEIILESFRDKDLVRLHAWRDGAALAMFFQNDDHAAPEMLREGDVFTFEVAEETVALRLEQVMSAALPVLDEDVKALRLQTPQGELRLREGQSMQLDESRLRFRRLPQPPETRYTFEVLDAAPETSRQNFVLGPQETRRIGQWRFTHDVTHPDTERIAVVRAERGAGTPAQYVGALLFIVGALGLILFRFGDRQTTSHEHASRIMKEDTWTVVPPEDDLPPPPAENDQE